MSGARDQIRKRQLTDANQSLGPSQYHPKRQMSRIKLHSAEFYDSLSKVELTRRALKELDRRSQDNSPRQPGFTLRRLTQNAWIQIRDFAKDGGPELGDLRGYPPPGDALSTRSMSCRHSHHSSISRQTKSTVPTSTSSKIGRSSAYDDNFGQHLADNQIYTEGYDYPDGRRTPEPALEGFHQRLAEPRPSLSPSRFTNTDFRDFRHANARVISKGKVMRTVLPVVYGKSDIPNEGDLVFKRLYPIANNTTVDAKPDFYDGARLGDLDKKVQEDIGDYIIPTGHATAPVVPNFFLEAKAPRGGADVAKRQACYNGALGARAMHQLQSYKQEPAYDGEAYTISTTYHAGTGTLKMYTTHPTEGPEGSTEYHMTQVSAFALDGSPEDFRRGAAAFRNARDWAREQRDKFIFDANARARSESSQLAPPDENDRGDFAEVQDASQVSQAEDPEHDSRDYTPQHQEEYHDQLNFASNIADFSDELAFDAPTIPNKRQHTTSETKTSRTPRRSGKSGGKRPKR